MGKEVEIATYSNLAEAELAKQTLEANGLSKIIILNESGGGALGQTLAHGIKILVPEADAQTARSLLGQPEPGDLSDKMWKCTKCGEEIEWQFTECWSCGSERELV